MDKPYWHKQSPGTPLFPDLLWSRPENRLTAGKLIIVGGNVHSFAAVAEAYKEAARAGIGVARVVLPDALQSAVGKVFSAGEFAPSTPSGSLARQALAPILHAASWGDGLLVAGDLGRNAETAILIESLLQKSKLPITLTQDAIGYVASTPQVLQERSNLTLVLSLSQLQRLVATTRYPMAVTFNMDTLRLVDWLHNFTLQYPTFLITEHLGILLVACQGEVSTTKLAHETDLWRVKVATHASVWWLQNMQKPFAALTTAVADI